jgi:selenocysteine-specific elongation factor
MFVIATAGHVDHGKSALVAALTGTHPDRLIEEKIREMTIDLGFAWFSLPSGEEVGVIDVPGHIDFIENMLAGMGGMDAVLLVIAADEGIMPQTREHIAIIDLLEIKNCIIVLTKIDLIDEPGWLDLLEEEIKLLIANTSFANAPFVRVSAKSGGGVPQLISTINQILGSLPEKIPNGKPRLPIDRVFSLPGFGTIVTGSLRNSALGVDSSVMIQPQGTSVRIRSIQVHKKKVQVSYPGTRTAINLTGIDYHQIHRGDVLVLRGEGEPTARIDVEVRLLGDPGVKLRHNDGVRFFTGTTEKNARVRLLGAKSLAGSEEGFLQLELDEPVSLEKGDHYIIRKASPSITLGGGIVLECHPKSRYKLDNPAVIENLQRKKRGSLEDEVIEQLCSNTVKSIDELAISLSKTQTEINQIVDCLVDQKEVILINLNRKPPYETYLVYSRDWEKITRKLIKLMGELHTKYPFKAGFPKEEILRPLKINHTQFKVFLHKWEEEGLLIHEKDLYRSPTHLQTLTSLQEKKKTLLWKKIDQNPFSPPAVVECLETLGIEFFGALVESGELVKLSDVVVFRQTEFQIMLEYVSSVINRNNTISVAEFRDKFQTSRKFALAVLEHLDRVKVTRREGDVRVKY